MDLCFAHSKLSATLVSNILRKVHWVHPDQIVKNLWKLVQQVLILPIVIYGISLM